MMPAVSVVIATYKRDDLLKRCLSRVLDQELEAPFEIVVVDDACSPTVAGAIEEVRRQYSEREVPISLLPGRSCGPATARNIGWRAARGPVIAFTDDDAFPFEHTWLASGLRWFDDQDVNGVGGAVVVPTDQPPTDFQRNVKALERGQFLTCNAFYRRSALEEVDGFDERFTAPFREDSDLQYRVDRLGGRMVTDPQLLVIHPAPRGRFAISLKLQQYGMFNALLYKKHPERYRREVQPWPPLLYYAMLACLAGAVIALFAGFYLLSLILGLVWLGMVVRFFLRRIDGASRAPRDLVDMAVTSVLIPPVSVYWRIRGAVRYRVIFL